MSYVDGFLVPVPKKNLAAYRTMARKAGKLWLEMGALQYCECVGDDLTPKGAVPFTKGLKLKPGETVVFAWITYRNKAHRDKVNKAIMKDPRIAAITPKVMPFDFKRMVYGGFKAIVDLSPDR